MAYKAVDVAKWILSAAKSQGIVMTHMKLQKLLYYAQAYALGMSGQPLFVDEIQAWKHGPVIPTVYRAYSKYERAPIQDIEDTPIPDDEVALIHSLIFDKGRLTASDLRKFTHEEAPWKDAWEKWEGCGPMPNIPTEAIEAYFAPQFWASDEENDYQPVLASPEEEREYFLEHITDEERHAICESR